MLADTSIEVVLEISFLSFNNADVKFAELGKLTWRSYTAVEALPTTNWLEFIGKRKFAKTALDKNSETFVVHVVALEAETSIYLLWAAKIAALQ